MVESLNTRADFSTEAIAYLGFPKYGKVMIGDAAFEFFNDRNVADNMQFPFPSILRVEGEVSKRGSVGRYYTIVLNNQSKVRFASKESGKLLKLFRERLGNERVVKAPTFSGTFLKIFKRNKK